MAKIGIFLTSGPFPSYHYKNSDLATNIAQAALDKNHEVIFFLYLDGVLNPIKYQTFPDLALLPKDKFAEVIEKGAKVIACGLCVNARGLENGKDYIDGVIVGGLPDFAESVGEVDTLITL